ncbi:MAG: transposase [Nitrososphaeraceae archaeon]|nr:transposase [Nitrososphaeraceae archaeon]
MIFVDRATPHSKRTKQYLAQHKDTIRLEYFPVGCPEFNPVEECWRQGKYHILSTYHSTCDALKYNICCSYRNTRFILAIVRYFMRTID